MNGTENDRDAPATPRGSVALVGAGPGDPELWTRRAVRLLREADLVLYDALVDHDALSGLTSARLVCVGKRAGQAGVEQDAIHDLMIRAAQDGQRVVRFQGGDPFLLGRGGEEALALAEAGVPFEVVPGVTSAVAAPELAGIPVTHRGTSSAVLVVSGHTTEALDSTLDAIRPHTATVVVLMGLARRRTRGRPVVPDRLVARDPGGHRLRGVHTGRLDVDRPVARFGRRAASRRSGGRAGGRRRSGVAGSGGGSQRGPAGTQGGRGDVWPQLTMPGLSGEPI